MKEKRKKRKLRRRILKITLIVVIQVICLFAYLFTSSHFVKGLLYKNSTYENDIIIEADESIESEFTVFKDDILYSTRNGVDFYDMDGKHIRSSHAANISSVISTFAEPEIRLYKNSACAFDKNGRKFIIFDNKNVLVSDESEYSIQGMKVFDNNSFAIISGDSGAKNQMSLYNEKGAKRFIWHSGTDNIIDTAIMDDGSKTVVLTVELKEGSLNSKLLYFNKGEENAFAVKKYDNILFTNINFIDGNTLLGISDSGLFYLDNSGNEKKMYSFNDKFLSSYKISDEGYTVLNFASLSDYASYVEIVSPSGKLSGKRNLSEEVISIDIKDSNILLSYKNSADIITLSGRHIRHINNGRSLINSMFIGRNRILLAGKSDIKVIR